jgi:HD-GYP domain-containing protein (c-di-GMP phosphodiesterase class II)
MSAIVGLLGQTRDGSAELPDTLRTLMERASNIGVDLRPCRVADHAEGVSVLPASETRSWIVVRMGNAAVAGELRTVEAERIAEILRWTHEDLVARSQNDAIVADFCDKLAQAYEETYALFRALRMLASSEEPEAMVHSLCRDIQRTLPFRWIAVQFGRRTEITPPLRARLILSGAFPADCARLGELASDHLAQLAGDSWTKVLTPAKDPIAALAHSEVICEPVTHDDAVIGLLLAGGKSGADPEIASGEIQFLDATADFLGTFHENSARFDEQRSMMNSTLEALVAAIDAKDRYTCGHSERVALLASAIARALGMDDASAERVRLSGLVHDVGKIGVAEAILCKPGKPTDEEFAAIKRHPEIGHRILHGINGFEDLLPGVLHHHERWDGRGYPHKLEGEKIPLIARIIGLADAFDAMSSSRSYRNALPRERVIEEIRRGAGTQFDPRVAAAFELVDLTPYDQMLQSHAGTEAWAQRAAA